MSTRGRRIAIIGHLDRAARVLDRFGFKLCFVDHAIVPLGNCAACVLTAERAEAVIGKAVVLKPVDVAEAAGFPRADRTDGTCEKTLGLPRGGGTLEIPVGAEARKAAAAEAKAAGAEKK